MPKSIAHKTISIYSLGDGSPKGKDPIQKHLKSGPYELLRIIRSLSKKEGYTYADNAYLSECCRCSVSSITRYLAILEKNKCIYRSTFSTKMGKKRHLIPVENCFKYFAEYLSKRKVPDSVFFKFKEFLSGFGRV